MRITLIVFRKFLIKQNKNGRLHLISETFNHLKHIILAFQKRRNIEAVNDCRKKFISLQSFGFTSSIVFLRKRKKSHCYFTNYLIWIFYTRYWQQDYFYPLYTALFFLESDLDLKRKKKKKSLFIHRGFYAQLENEKLSLRVEVRRHWMKKIMNLY